MKKEQFAEILGDINENYVKEAKMNQKVSNKIWIRWAAMAACLCLILCGTLFLNRTNRPDPEPVQVPNPIVEVASLEEMEQYLDFQVPVLEKDVEAYIVMVIEEYPRSARIIYKDGACFNMMYGSGDISGIYGGVMEKEETVDGTAVTYYTFEDIHYALWEKDGFTYSLTGGEALTKEVAALINCG